MISIADLKLIARARLKDADVLFRNKRYDCAVYVCGYAVEVALKTRICQTLKWSEFPETNSEFQPYQSLKTHNPYVLLRLSGIESAVKAGFLSQWSDVANAWSSEMRYQRVSTITEAGARIVISAARILVKRMLP